MVENVMAAPAQITDRAKRYRAVNAVEGPMVCVMCGAKPSGGRPLDVMHLSGNESDGDKKNLAYGCRSCNGRLAAAFKKIGAGVKTKQYNPAKGGVPTYDQYAWAVAQQNHSGEHGEAGAIIHATPKSKRIEYAKTIARKAVATKRAASDERWNPAAKTVKILGREYRVGTKAQRGETGRGRSNPASASADVFEEFHGHPSAELIEVKKRVHSHEHLAAAGRLERLVVLGVDGREHEIEGFGKSCFLAFNEAKSQLFIEGGDQSINLDDFGIRKPHEMETLGRVKVIDYHTDKSHLGDEGGRATYTHTFRTTNKGGKHVTIKPAKYPTLIYDVVNEQLLLSGGSYSIRAEGIDV